MLNNRIFTPMTVTFFLVVGLFVQVFATASQGSVVFAQNDSSVALGIRTTATPTRKPTLTKTLRPTSTKTRQATITRTKTRTKTLTPTRTRTRTATAAPTFWECFECKSDFIGVPVSGTAPLSVHFTALTEFPITSCTWVFGDGTSQTFMPPAGQDAFSLCPSTDHVYHSAGGFTVSLRTTELGLSQWESVEKVGYISVIEVATPTITPTPCQPTIMPTNTPWCFDCSIPKPLTSSCTSTATPSKTPTATPSSVPGVDFRGAPVSGNIPLTVQFTSLSSSVLSSCAWNFGDGTGQTFNPPAGQSYFACPSPSHVYTTAGTFTVSLRVTKYSSGSSNTMTKANYIHTTGLLPTPTATVTVTQVCFDCEQPTITPTITSTPIITPTPTVPCFDCW